MLLAFSVISIRPGAGVYLRALSSRIHTSLRRLGKSPMTFMLWLGSRDSDSASCRSTASGRACSKAVSITSAKSSFSQSLPLEFASARASTSMSPNNTAAFAPSSTISSKAWRLSASMRGFLNATSAIVLVKDSGARSSCDASAVNWLIRWTEDSKRASMALQVSANL